MTSLASPTFRLGMSAVLIEAARSWRRARDHGERIQPRMTKHLAHQDCAILVPVLDSLIRFYERALGRPMAVGSAATISDDEALLIGLLDGSRPIACAARLADALDHALRSTRIMLALALDRPAQPQVAL